MFWNILKPSYVMNYSQAWLKLLGHSICYELESCLILGKGIIGNQMIIGKVSMSLHVINHLINHQPNDNHKAKLSMTPKK